VLDACDAGGVGQRSLRSDRAVDADEDVPGQDGLGDGIGGRERHG
jgi:hypothetical protein